MNNKDNTLVHQNTHNAKMYEDIERQIKQRLIGGGTYLEVVELTIEITLNQNATSRLNRSSRSKTMI